MRVSALLALVAVSFAADAEWEDGVLIGTDANLQVSSTAARNVRASPIQIKNAAGKRRRKTCCDISSPPFGDAFSCFSFHVHTAAGGAAFFVASCDRYLAVLRAAVVPAARPGADTVQACCVFNILHH